MRFLGGSSLTLGKGGIGYIMGWLWVACYRWEAEGVAMG